MSKKNLSNYLINCLEDASQAQLPSSIIPNFSLSDAYRIALEIKEIREGKKEKALWEGKGRPPVFKRIQKESDWKTYYGSHHLIKEYVKGGFEHELKLKNA